MPIANPNYEIFQKVALDLRMTDEQVRAQGQDVTWRRAMDCPNRISNLQSHNLNCALCSGDGHLYDSDAEAKVIKLAVMSVGLQQMFLSQGRYDAGSAIITAESGNQLSYWDTVEMSVSTLRFTEAIQRGEGAADKLRYRPLSVIKLVDSAGVRYALNGSDFGLNATGIQWVAGRGPAVGTFYSVMYQCRPVYVVLDLLHMHRTLVNRGQTPQALANFPVQAVAKLDFLVDRQPVGA